MVINHPDTLLITERNLIGTESDVNVVSFLVPLGQGLPGEYLGVGIDPAARIIAQLDNLTS